MDASVVVVSEMARQLRVTPQWVLNRVYRGQIKATQQGSTWLIPEEELNRYLKLKEFVEGKRGRPWKDNYVYAHLTPDGKAFYIGAGTGQRIHNFGPEGRSKEYNEIAEPIRDKIQPILIKHKLTIDEACRLEKLLVSSLVKLGQPLVNKVLRNASC